MPHRWSSSSGRWPSTSNSSVPVAPSRITQRSVAILWAIAAYGPVAGAGAAPLPDAPICTTCVCSSPMPGSLDRSAGPDHPTWIRLTLPFG